jgi:hypothetical protein
MKPHNRIMALCACLAVAGAAQAGTSQLPDARSSQAGRPASIAGGFPCVHKVCLNESIKGLSQVKWVDPTPSIARSNYHRPLEQAAAKWLQHFVPGVSARERELLLRHVNLMSENPNITLAVDAGLLQFLAERRPLFCRAVVFEGRVSSEGGLRMLVQLQPGVVDRGDVKVTALEVTFPTEDPVAVTRMEEQIARQHPYVAPDAATHSAHTASPPWMASGQASYEPGQLHFALKAPGDDAYAQQPGCADGALALD